MILLIVRTKGGIWSRLIKLPPKIPNMSINAEPMLPTCAGERANAVINMPQPVAPNTAARITGTMNIRIMLKKATPVISTSRMSEYRAKRSARWRCRRGTVDGKGLRGAGVTGDTNLTRLIPGIGVSHTTGEQVTVFGGVHRGFAPPRTEDIISNTGGVVDLDPELSWNYEAGVRSSFVPGVGVDATFFRMDYENQIIPASLAGGIGATLTNAGATLPRRDAVDERIIKTVRTGEVTARVGPNDVTDFNAVGFSQQVIDSILERVPKGVITHPSQVGGYPDYKGSPYADADGDGMPDDWEKKHGLNPNDASDASGDLNGDGYTNIEDFINGLDPRAPKVDRADLKNNVHARNR